MKYVVSEDIKLLLESWLKKSNAIIPEKRFFVNLRKRLKSKLEEIFGENNVIMVQEKELTKGMANIVNSTELPIVSMDRIYGKYDYALDVSRTVTNDLEDCGSAHRFGYSLLEVQILNLKKHKFREVVLVDDVIFSGNGCIDVVVPLKEAGIVVRKVIAGIVIEGGRKELESLGINVIGVKNYDNVIDEICERDFYAGVPFSGRTLAGVKTNIGVPYFFPFGDPAKWASIPQNKVENFSRFCLKQSILLWQEIENINGREMLCSDIPRLPIGAPNNNTSFIHYLAGL